MSDRRYDIRMLCAELVEVSWKTKTGRVRRETASLDDISESGACVQLDQAVPEGARITVELANREFTGNVHYCVDREAGYYVGVEFDPDCHWDPAEFEPGHMLDPRTVAGAPRKQQ